MFPCSGRLGGVLDQPREVPRVHHGGAEVESIPVASAPEKDPVRREHAAQPRDVRLEAMGGRGRRIVAPDVVDQALVAHDLAGAEKQRGEDGALLATAQLERQAVHVSLERAEDPEPKWR